MIWLRPRAWGNTRYHAFRETPKSVEEQRAKKAISLCGFWLASYNYLWSQSHWYTEDEDPWMPGKKRCLQCLRTESEESNA